MKIVDWFKGSMLWPLMALLLLSVSVPSHGRIKGHSTGIVQTMVVNQAFNLGVDPSLALAVAHVESSFVVDAVSSAGARGVMQVMPATGWGEFGVHPDELWNAKVNIRVGLSFLKMLIDDYRGDLRFALSYYNGGSAVGVWPNAKVLPYTQAYVDKVLELRAQYGHELRRRGVI